mgnify:FL=1
MRKYIKLLAFLCLPLAFTACDDDESLNGGEATVQFKETSMTISERTTSLNLPIVVTGDHTGLIKVRVECVESNGLKDDENIITSRDLRIPAGVEEVEVEIATSMLTEEEDHDRYFTLEIVSAEGAQIGNGTCRIDVEELKKVEPLTYDEMIGTWTFVCEDGTFDLNVTEDVAGESLTCTGFMGDPSLSFTLNYDAATSTPSLPLGQVAYTANYANLGGDVLVVWSALDGNSLAINGNVTSTWYDDGEIEFNGTLAGGIFSAADGSFTGYVDFQWTNPHMVKKQ